MVDLDGVESVRPRCKQLFDHVASGDSKYFSLDLARLDVCADLVKRVMDERYGDKPVPYHSRLRHFPGEILTKIDHADVTVKGKRYFDLVTVSVLLDAGAGHSWKYQHEGITYTRSEGLGVASLVMFINGFFSSDPKTDPLRVDASRLVTITESELEQALQVSDSNPLLGLTGRLNLLKCLGLRLADVGFARPCALLASLGTKIDLRTVWKSYFAILAPLWPRKDRWVHSGLDLEIPFHKLLQWLFYSYVEVFERICNFQVEGKDIQTGLPEYRNGGLFVDLEILSLKTPQSEPADVGSDLIIEWRACTVVLLDLLREKKFPGLPLSCLLEGGTWVAGRRAAAAARPATADSPILVNLDGTVF